VRTGTLDIDNSIADTNLVAQLLPVDRAHYPSGAFRAEMNACIFATTNINRDACTRACSTGNVLRRNLSLPGDRQQVKPGPAIPPRMRHMHVQQSTTVHAYATVSTATHHRKRQNTGLCLIQLPNGPWSQAHAKVPRPVRYDRKGAQEGGRGQGQKEGECSDKGRTRRPWGHTRISRTYV
jgi:hypothetical protein